MNTLDRMYWNAVRRIRLAKETVRATVREWWEEERGSTSAIVVEIVLVGMILVLAFIFRKQIGQLFADLWNSLVKFDDNPGTVTPSSMSNPF